MHLWSFFMYVQKQILKCISTLKIFFDMWKSYIPVTYYTKNQKKKGSMVAKKNVFKAIKILLKPMGLREEYSFTIVL